MRTDIVAPLASSLGASSDLSAAKRAELAGQFGTRAAAEPCWHHGATGTLRIDQPAVTRVTHRNGGERAPTARAGWPQMSLGSPPVWGAARVDATGALEQRDPSPYYRRADRAGARVPWCEVALVVLRVAASTADDTWRSVATALDPMHFVTRRPPAHRLFEKRALLAGAHRWPTRVGRAAALRRRHPGARPGSGTSQRTTY